MTAFLIFLLGGVLLVIFGSIQNSRNRCTQKNHNWKEIESEKFGNGVYSCIHVKFKCQNCDKIKDVIYEK